MSTASLARLLLLSAIWGGSFLFLRIAAPALGALPLAQSRALFAALFLLAVAWFLRRPLPLREHWRHFLILGLLNSALPFLLFGYAAQTASASLLSIVNAMSPIWAALIAAVWTRSAIAPATLLGLALGVAGVAVLVGYDSVTLEPGAWLAIGAALAAAFCYGLATNYARHAPGVDALSNAHGNLWAAALLLMIPLPFAPLPELPGIGVVAAVAALGIVCSGVAYLLYFRLIADIGAAPALTVTFLIPVFGVLWGWLFLGEPVGSHTLAGAALVLGGTMLVTGFSPRALLAARAQSSRVPLRSTRATDDAPQDLNS